MTLQSGDGKQLLPPQCFPARVLANTHAVATHISVA